MGVLAEKHYIRTTVPWPAAQCVEAWITDAMSSFGIVEHLQLPLFWMYLRFLQPIASQTLTWVHTPPRRYQQRTATILRTKQFL